MLRRMILVSANLREFSLISHCFSAETLSRRVFKRLAQRLCVSVAKRFARFNC